MENNTIDRASLGRAVLHYTKLSLDSAISVLHSLEGKVKIIHVRYSDTVKIPKEKCKEIIETAGLFFIIFSFFKF